jgi:hypothetical protein
MDGVAEVSQLVLRERQSRVRGLSAELVACFHEDATVETSWMRGSPQAFAAGGVERTASGGTIGSGRRPCRSPASEASRSFTRRRHGGSR